LQHRRLDFVHKQRESSVQGGQGVIPKIELVLRRVAVVDHDPGWAPRRGQVTEHLGEGVRSGHHIGLHNPLHCTRREVREHHRKMLWETLEEHEDDVVLAERDVVVVERGEE